MSFMDRNMTNVLKGIAVIFMFVHHFFTFPSWYIDSISYPELKEAAAFFCSPLKLCVGIFAFLTGYGYFYVKSKNLKYSLRKITLFLTKYWSVYIPLLAMAIVLGCHEFHFTVFLLELLALKRPIMYFCWYVYVYVIAMLVLPVLVRITRNHPFGMAFGGMIVVNYFCSLLFQCVGNDIVQRVVSDFRTFFPVMVAGYLFALLDIFHSVFDWIFEKIRFRWLCVILWMGMVVIPFAARHYHAYQNTGGIVFGEWYLTLRITFDILYVPVFLYGVVKLVKCSPFKRLLCILEELGKYSAEMWFWHCMFFNVCKEYTQPVLYFLKEPIVVLMWGLGVCWVLARVWRIDVILKVFGKKSYN